MSEYQYYEFLALEQALSKEQMRELRAVSSRGQITATSFTNEYNWGDFKGDPVAWMKKYFDASVYVSNFGVRWFMLRVPKSVLGEDILKTYCAMESFSYRTSRTHIILLFELESENYDWVEGDGWMASLSSLRSDLIRGIIVVFIWVGSWPFSKVK